MCFLTSTMKRAVGTRTGGRSRHSDAGLGLNMSHLSFTRWEDYMKVTLRFARALREIYEHLDEE